MHVSSIKLFGATAVWSCGLAVCAFAAQPTVHEVEDRLEVRWQGDLVAELSQGRFLRFRASGFNDHWIGTKAAPMDLAWDYADVNEYVVGPSDTTTGEGRFEIVLHGTKPSVDGVVTTRLAAEWSSEQNAFVYELGSRLQAGQKKWRTMARRARGAGRDRALRVEALDFHLNRISRSDLMDWRNSPGDDLLYEGVVLAHPGEGWRFVPPVYLPYPVRRGQYPTIFWTHDRLAEVGYRIGYLDRREGGWLQEFTALSSPMLLEQCWLAVDVHHFLPAGVPAESEGQDRFENFYTFRFKPVSRREAQAVLDETTTIDWQERPEYQLPVFHRYSTFEERLSRTGQYAWLASSSHCAIDDRIGYDDRHSIRISHAAPDLKSAWYVPTWGTYFDTPTLLQGKFRLSALVKTDALTGEFRLAFSKYVKGNWLRQTGAWSRPEAEWVRSAARITDTHDWTRMHVDVEIDLTQEEPFTRHALVLEYEGQGTLWIDNVRIQQLE